jgi:hypothetical protein
MPQVEPQWRDDRHWALGPTGATTVAATKGAAMRARLLRALTAVAVVGGAALVAAGPSRADIVEPPGACVGTASFATGTAADGPFSVDSQVLSPDDVTVVPLSDTVTWTGEVAGVAPGTSREVEGFVRLDLPWPLPDATIDSWNSTTTRTANQGVEEYDLPSALPRGAGFRVYGEHREDGELVCSGSATVALEGGAFSSPVTVAATVLAIPALAALVWAGFPKVGRRV